MTNWEIYDLTSRLLKNETLNRKDIGTLENAQKIICLLKEKKNDINKIIKQLEKF